MSGPRARACMRSPSTRILTAGMVLRNCYAVSSTDSGYGATSVKQRFLLGKSLGGLIAAHTVA
eukprot:1338707-Rhodomonas_salina.6